MAAKGTGIVFNFDPYKDVKVTENLDKDILIISKQKLKSILLDAEASFGKKELWLTPFTLLITLTGLFVTTDFKQFIVSADIWQAFFLMLSLFSIIWLIWAVRVSLKSKKVDDILNDCMRGTLPSVEAIYFAPKVVETYPLYGEIIKVPRTGKEIMFSVTYNQAMRKGYSVCGVRNTASPEKINEPRWSDDGRTFKFTMKIYPQKI